MKILCYVNHFFGQNPFFEGKSSLSTEVNAKELEEKGKRRKLIVEQTVAQLRKIGAEVKICGIQGYSLVPIDIHFEQAKDRPLLLIYESLNHMAKSVDDYDYFINIEDDIFLSDQVLRNTVEFDAESFVNEILLPNRMEQTPLGEWFCVDFKAISQWTHQQKTFNGKQIRVALNPHSALLIMSREKFKYALKHTDRNYRKPFLYNELDSAFAYFHSAFSLYRTSDDLLFHSVVHMDRWKHSEGEYKHEGKLISTLKSLRFTDFVPPVLTRAISYLRKAR